MDNSTKQSGRIVYLEPNNLPGFYVNTSKGVKTDNITWQQEDFNIMVDLQVVIPSRQYRKGNVNEYFDYESDKIEKMSILSGVELSKNSGSFLSTDYTTISYQEIKDNKAGSKEMLGINSIDISFDSNLYPRVQMRLTDVRAASLMMPQEQVLYDVTGKEKINSDEVCKSFFQSFFRFPYPRFELTVKGFYGTCVTFVLSVENFKASFNSETGNFDVNISFIGSIYGLYTDIPMNLIILAPYIGKNVNEYGYNQYWAQETSSNGRFFYIDYENNNVGVPISTFFQFLKNYKDLYGYLTSKNDDEEGIFNFGPNTVQLARNTQAIELINNILNHLIKLDSYVVQEPHHVETFDDGLHLIFYNDKNWPSFINFNLIELNDMRNAFIKYEENIEPLVLPGEYDSEIVNSISYFFGSEHKTILNVFTDEVLPKGFNGRIIHADSIDTFLDDLTEKDSQELKQKYGDDISYLTSQYNRVFSYDFNLLYDFFLDVKKRWETENEFTTKNASKELQDIFKQGCGFIPTIENVMRMIFAHLDCFMHVFYTLLDDIETDANNDRRSINDTHFLLHNTDVIAYGSNSATLPPFPAIYDKDRKRIFPGNSKFSGKLNFISNIKEVDFVRGIFTKFSQVFEEESIIAKARSGIVKKGSGFKPIALTDYFYEGKNPYDYIVRYNNPFEIIYFALCRLSLVNYSNLDDDKKNKIIKREIDNLVNSKIFKKIKADARFLGLNTADFVGNLNHVNKVIFNVNPEEYNRVFKIMPLANGYDYFKFDGLNLLTTDEKNKYFSRSNFLNEEVFIDGEFKDFLEEYESDEILNAFLDANFNDDSDERIKEDWTSYSSLANSPVIVLPESKGEKFIGAKYPFFEGTEYFSITDDISKDIGIWGKHYPFIFISRKNKIYIDGTQTITMNEILNGTIEKNRLWVPAISMQYGNAFFDSYYCTIEGYYPQSDPSKLEVQGLKKADLDRRFNGNAHQNTWSENKMFDGDIKSNEARALWFLYRLRFYTQVKSSFECRESLVCKYKYVLLFMGGCIRAWEKGWDAFGDAIFGDDGDIPYEYVEKIFYRWKDSKFRGKLRDMFVDWVGGDNNPQPEPGTFAFIFNEIKKEHDKDKYYWAFLYPEHLKDLRNSTERAIWAPLLDPYNRDLQDVLIDLVCERSYFMLFEDKMTEEVSFDILDTYLRNLNDAIIEYNPEFNTSDERIFNASEAQRENIYYTLKNLYDKWLCSYSEESFKLCEPENEQKQKENKYNSNFINSKNKNLEISEFSNFLYVDSFYNNISKDFMVNPGKLFDLINNQVAGITNFNVLDFIWQLCSDNKLLFRCLPVYNNIYNVETYKDIFTPLSLYSAADKLKRRIGNTYLLMYTYEASNKLRILADKADGVSMSDDGFDLIDSTGAITQEAIKLFKDGKECPSVCAFGVTPGMQNQSYFTKITVGMDAPRVTDFALKNMFQLAEGSIGGTIAGIGTGQDLYSIYSNRSYDCSVEMLGCINIMPMMYFQLNNVPMFKGTYMITKVNHSIQNNSMTTKFVGTRLSKYFIPYNEEIFNVEQLSDLIKRLIEKGINDGAGTTVLESVEINGSYGADNYKPIEYTYGNGNEFYATQPDSEKTIDRKFNIWAAVNQMCQTLWSGAIPYTMNSDAKNSVTDKHLCATAVEMFLMAGFNGLFVASSPKQGQIQHRYCENPPDFKETHITYNGYNGYWMKEKLAELGFSCIANGLETIDKMKDGNQLQVGDVCVIAQGGTRIENKQLYGHVCMWSGEFWVSDFRQANLNVYSKYKTGDKAVSKDEYGVLLYRYPTDKLINKKQVYSYFDKNGKEVKLEDSFNVNVINSIIKNKTVETTPE